jgi:putative Mg2+ transporter-C (MgtC) family protein
MTELWQSLVRELRLELLLQLLLAVLLGGAIGLERELKGKPAGLRTNILIIMGATLFTALSFRMAGYRGDPARVAAQILPGVGFIGAGTILHLRGSVTGLTSAATIWVVAAIGMSLGAGAYLEALGTTFVVMVVLAGLGRAESLIGRQAARSRLRVHASPGPTTLEDLQELVRVSGVEIEDTRARTEDADLVVEFDLVGPKRLHDQILISLLHHPGVRSVSTGE